MNGRRVSVECGIFTDPDMDGWPAEAKYLYIYLLLNEHTHGLTGIGRIGPRTMVSETGLAAEAIETVRPMIRPQVVWFECGAYWVVGRPKYTCYKQDRTINPKVALGAARHVAGLPDEIREAFAARYPEVVALDGGADTPETAAPSPRRRAGRKAGSAGGRGPGTLPFAWSEFEAEAVMGAMPAGWPARGEGEVARLMRWPSELVLATTLDIVHGNQRPEDGAEAVRWLFHRLTHAQSPSARHLRQARETILAHDKEEEDCGEN